MKTWDFIFVEMWHQESNSNDYYFDFSDLFTFLLLYVMFYCNNNQEGKEQKQEMAKECNIYGIVLNLWRTSWTIESKKRF